MTVLFFSLPVVQNSIGDRLTSWLNEKYKTNINIDKVSLSLLGNVELKGVYIEDYQKDTLAYIHNLSTSILSVRNAINGKLQFGNIDVDQLTLNVKTYRGSIDTNLDVFVNKLDSGESDPNAEPFLLSASEIHIEDSKFRLIDENKETPVMLDLRNLGILTEDFKIDGPNVTTNINKLTFLSKRGVLVEKLSTDFAYSKTQMNFHKLRLETPGSFIEGDISFLYDREDFADFLNKVKLEATIKESTVAFDEVNMFYNEFGKGRRVTFSSELKGVLNNIEATNLKLTSENTRINGNFDFINLFDSDKELRINAGINNLSSNYHQLRALMPNLLGESLPSSFAKLGQFSITGDAVITEEAIDAKLALFTDLGESHTDMRLTNIDDIDNASYKGFISLNEFDLGTFFNDKKLGKTTLDFNVDGQGFTQKNLNTVIDGKIFLIQYNRYNYKDVEVSGVLKDQLFDGKLVSNDENFQMAFEGLADLSGAENMFNFRATVDYADLKKLHFAANDSVSIFKGNVYMDVVGNTFDNLRGEVIISRTNYTNYNDSYYFEDLKVTSKFEGEERVLEINSPDIIEGYIKGKFSYSELGNMVRNSVGSIYTNYEPYEISPGQHLEFNLKIYNKIVEVFLPEVEFGKNTFIRGNMVADNGDFKLTFKSPSINAYGNSLDNVNLQIDNKNPLYNTFLEIAGIDAGFYKISEFNLINATIKDTLFFRTEFKGGDDQTDIYNLNFYHTFGSDQKSVIGLKTSDVGFKGNNWIINRENNSLNKVTFNKSLDTISIQDIVMNYENEQINLRGEIVDSTYKDIRLQFKNVNLDKITPNIDSLKLEGIVNGNLNILQRKNSYLPSSNVTIEKLAINDIPFGNLDVGIIGNENLTRYAVDARLINDQIEALNVLGDISLVNNKYVLDIQASLQQLDLGAFSPLGEDVISNIRGHATGTARITGDINNPDMSGQLLISNGGLKIPYLNVDLNFSKAATVNLFGQSVEFDNITLTDTKYKTSSLLYGTITHNKFEDWYLDLTLDTGGNRFLVLDTEYSEDELYYGTGFISGDAYIFGLTDELTIKVNGATESGTSLKIPVSDVTSIGDASFLNFIDKNERISEEERQRQLKDYKGLEMDFDLDVTPEAEVEIVLDRKSGSTLKGRGAGNLLIEINTNGKFRMWGDFITYKGDYNFKYGGFIDKKFEVQPGGTINWDGDPLAANVNIKGIYSLYANPAVLLDNSQYTRKINTEVIISLTGELMKPELDYEIRFPLANAVTNSELQYKLEDKNRRELQALSLLAQGVFINELSINTGQALASNIAETASSIVNQILNAGDGKFDFGFNYEVGERNPDLDFVTEDRVGVTVSTQISERILINGKIGVPVGGVTETVVAGDVEVQVLLNEDGTLSAKIFNRENEIQQFLVQQQGYTQGVGLSYQVDFNTFGELWKKLFGKKEKLEEPVEAPQEEQGTLGNGLVKFSNKSKNKSKR